MNRLAALLLPAALLAACTADPTTSARDHAIIGGTASRDDHAVVLLASFPQDRSVLLTCTAVVISPTVLATAAHCVDEANHPNYLFGAFLGEDASIYPRLVDLEPHLVAVREVHAHPSYDTAPPFRADIGVAILAEPLTGITPIPLWRTPLTADLVGDPARIVGYGQAVVGEYSATRRQAATVVDGLDPDDTVRVGDATHRTCLGDSGGPALLDDGSGERLIGINSYADNGLCNRPAHFRRADLYQAFFDQYTGDRPMTPDAGTGADGGGGMVDGGDDGGCAAGGNGGGAASGVVFLLVLALVARRRR